MGPKSLSWMLLILVGLSMVKGDSTDNTKPVEESLLARTADLDDFDLDLSAEESTFEVSGPGDAEPRFKIPYSYAFNGGKPFSLEKDPITGKIDFEKAPPLKALNYTHQELVQESKPDLKSEETDVEPNEINPFSSLHDFLNLPAHYSSDRYESKFPLISSSYANTKVQNGANSYSISNHKPYDASITPVFMPSRKVAAPKPAPSSTTSTTTTTTTVRTTTKRITTQKPTTTLKPSTTITASTMTPSTKLITTTRTTTPSTTTPSTTTSTTTTTTEKYTSMIEELERIPFSTSEVKATTWKPSTKLPLRKEQEKVTKEDTQTSKTSTTMDEYDGYEDYETEDDKKWESEKSQPTKSNSDEVSVSTPVTTPSSTTTSDFPTTPEYITTVETKKETMKHESGPLLVTSMPIESNDGMFDSKLNSYDSKDNFNSKQDNVVQGQRPEMVPGHVRFPNGGFDRPVPVESTSNIIVRPDQDMVSFVLGNRQNVEDVYYTQGTAVGENSYEEGSFKPLGSEAANGNGYHTIYSGPSDHSSVGLPSVSVEPAFNYQPERWYQQPSKNSNEVSELEKPNPNLQVTNNGPILQQGNEKFDEKKDENFNGFSGNKNQENRPVEEHVVVINEATGSVQEISPSTPVPPRQEGPVKDSMGHRIVPNAPLPQLSENLTPPERPKPSGPGQRPQFYYHYRPVGSSRPEYNRPPKIPMPPNRNKPNIPDFKRRTGPGPQDPKLPNILPQFRPNSKASHGHRAPDVIGTLPAPNSYGNRRPPPPHHISRRPNGPPSLLQRLNPPPPPTSGIPNIRLPSVNRDDSSSQSSEIVPTRFRQPSVMVPLRDDRFQLPKQKPRLEEEQSERFSIEPPQIPPRPVIYSKHRPNDHIPRVATLQMIQQRGGIENGSEPLLSSISDSDNKTENEDDNKTLEDSKTESGEKNPVYVVYPVNTALNIGLEESQDKDETVVVGTHGLHRPLPPDTLQQEENEKEEEDVQKKVPMMVLPVRPHLPSSPPVMASDFPYPLERPDPALLNQAPVREKPLLTPKDPDSSKLPVLPDDDDSDNTSVNVIPYLQDFVPFAAKKNHISATLQKLPTSTPIAYVFTPTAQTLTHRADIVSKDDDFDEKPILLPSQQPSSSSSSAPSPQNFMAPFVASMSVEAPVKNGWSVVVVNPNEKNQTAEDRKDVGPTAEDTQTERNDFDPDNFKPQLFGGFQPLYEYPSVDNEESQRNVEALPDIPRTIRRK